MSNQKWKDKDFDSEEEETTEVASAYARCGQQGASGNSVFLGQIQLIDGIWSKLIPKAIINYHIYIYLKPINIKLGY